VSRSAAQPRHNPTPLLPTIEFAQGPRPPQIAGGFLQVVVSKARERTVLVQAHCPSRFRYNSKTYRDLRKKLPNIFAPEIEDHQPIGDNKRQECRHGGEAVDEKRREVPKHWQEGEDGKLQPLTVEPSS